MTSKHSLFSSLGRRLGGLFKKESAPDTGPRALSDRGLLAFSHTGDVIRAERLLRQQGFDVDVKGPPPQMRTGCDMVVVFPLIRQAAVLASLKTADLEPEQVVSAHDVLLEPVSLFQTSRLEHWLMVRAANMKITVDCRDRQHLRRRLPGRALAGPLPVRQNAGYGPRTAEHGADPVLLQPAKSL